MKDPYDYVAAFCDEMDGDSRKTLGELFTECQADARRAALEEAAKVADSEADETYAAYERYVEDRNNLDPAREARAHIHGAKTVAKSIRALLDDAQKNESTDCWCAITHCAGHQEPRR